MRRQDGGEEETDVKIKTKRREEEEDREREREREAVWRLCGIVTHLKTMLPLLVMVTDCSLPLILIHHLITWLSACLHLSLELSFFTLICLSSPLWRASLPGEREETQHAKSRRMGGGSREASAPVHDRNSSKTSRPSWEPTPDPATR